MSHLVEWYLYLSEEERAEEFEFSVPKGDYAPHYARNIGTLLYAWEHGGSRALSTARCGYEIDRLVQAIFALPGYEPWSERAYPYC
ncbi:hypothetical protein [Gulosibacter sp. 10]|uniref:hypothetical protein n=1 Tax=Gulosibacter sp. 10 TaxID=1255570 RepID=UPI00097F1030|nr:hypothetical protein [Gulosibacter sp. 10]SJM68872.1 hypothetical protein FM112_13715 [Gulosibacter sp. 10]